jgi:hypothetical protein
MLAAPCGSVAKNACQRCSKTDPKCVSIVIGSRQLAEEQRCGKSEAFFLREFVHSATLRAHASAANR